MAYRIEVNLARKGSPPVWRPLLEDDSDAAVMWSDYETAQDYVACDTRELRIVPLEQVS